MIERMPLVSVVIPAYGARYLKEAIESVLTDRFCDLELIVCDDCSPTDLRTAFAAYDDLRLQFFRNDRNLGPEGNWNRCLDLARGKYFKLLPHDDFLFPGALSKQAQILEADKEERIALAFGARLVVDAEGKPLMTRGCPHTKQGIVEASDLVRLCVRRGTNVIGEPGAVLMRTALARKIGAFDASIPYLVDLDYWVRLLEHGDAYYLDEPVASFRVSPASWSVEIGTNQCRQFCRFIDRIRHLFRIRMGDVYVGRLMAYGNNFLRRILYSFILKPK